MLCQLLRVNGDAVLFSNVEHVENNDYGYTEFAELLRQDQSALKVAGINEVDDQLCLIVRQEVAGDLFIDALIFLL